MIADRLELIMIWRHKYGKGAVRIYYGEGHGKTNVAIGSAICAACEGRTAIIIQFLKGKNEQEFLSRLEPEVKFFNFSRAGILFEQLDEDSRQGRNHEHKEWL